MEAATAKAAELIEASLDDPFDGDAHALLMTVYKDKTQDLTVRLDAAKAAIRFEKPALQATKIEADVTLNHEDALAQLR